MDLKIELNNSQLYRAAGLPQNLGRICLILLGEDLKRIPQLLKCSPQIQIGCIMLPDLPAEKSENMQFSINNETVRVKPLSEIGNCPEYEKVFLCPENADIAALYLTRIARFAACHGIDIIYLAGNSKLPHTMRPPQPGFYRQAGSSLARACAVFEDNFSKRTFIGRIKAILTGNSGYIPIARHAEYFHDMVAPRPGDILIDGGVSDMVEAQRQMLESVGKEGRIYGFEPIPAMARKAAVQLAEYPNYKLQEEGLANSPGTAFFADLHDSSHIARGNSPENMKGMIKCKLTSIDEFCGSNHLRRIDCVKLDVEGAELQALQGAKYVIKKYRPRLIICLYHKPQDLYEIPLYIKSLVPEYRLYLAHSSCQFMDTVLYGIV